MTRRTIFDFQNISKEYRISRTFFDHRSLVIPALKDVNLSIREGEILGLVGESGCGKSTLAKVALGLELPTNGQVFFLGKDIQKHERIDLKEFRRSVQMVFQDPFSSLNPKKTVFQTISEPLKIHNLCLKKELRDRVAGLLKEVGFDEKAQDRYPHEFSGGQRQRIGLARALATEPNMIIADEPTAALDVSIQAQIINLLLDLQESRGLTYLFISHDLPVVQFVSHRIAVMYMGHIVEFMPKKFFLSEEMKYIHHPYTKYLIDAVPEPDPKKKTKVKWDKRTEITSREHGKGCPFHVKCSSSLDICRESMPVLTKVGSGHYIACHLFPGS